MSADAKQTPLKDFLHTVKYDSQGLVPAVIQDQHNHQVLMVGYMNQEALEKTLRGPTVWFYSRSKKRLWQKGESSGHIQTVKEIFFDCDQDCVLVKVIQNVAACHVGYRSCFFRKLEGEQVVVHGQKIFDGEGK